MSGPARPLLARAPGDGPSKGEDSSNNGSNNQFGGRPKRTLIESACAACRRRKSRCDGQRPTCTRCQNLRTECVYEAEEGESRWSALKRRSQTLEIERDDLREIFSLLRFRPEPEALAIFHRIRSGNYEELIMIARQSRESGSSAQPQNFPHPDEIGEQRLPPIRTLVNVPDSAQGGSRRGSVASRGSFHSPSMESGSDGSNGSYSPTNSAGEQATSQPPST